MGVALIKLLASTVFSFGLALLFSPTQAQGLAQFFPTRPVKIIIPSPPGDEADLAGRPISMKLRTRLGQPFVTDSKQGADDIIGRETVRNASPDGCTFIVGTASSHGINTAVYAKLPYGPVRDFVPVLLTNKAPNVCVVNPRIQAAPSVEFVALAKQEPSRCSFASDGNGSSGLIKVTRVAKVQL